LPIITIPTNADQSRTHRFILEPPNRFVAAAYSNLQRQSREKRRAFVAIKREFRMGLVAADGVVDGVDQGLNLAFMLTHGFLQSPDVLCKACLLFYENLHCGVDLLFRFYNGSTDRNQIPYCGPVLFNELLLLFLPLRQMRLCFNNRMHQARALRNS
jgi:hypothetical protein